MPQASVLKRGHVQNLSFKTRSSAKPLFYNEVMCKTFLVKMSFYYHVNKTHFHKKGFALGLVLGVGVFGIRKWPIVVN